ncbi:hypothetical protein CY35_19G077000 [Sphagnum magellanicum]|nr:hypothetical protein CY35_19G077000 [Sphagnum magellanicum]
MCFCGDLFASELWSVERYFVENERSFFVARDAYRKHPVISNNLRRPTLGLGIALAVFDVYLFVEGMTSKLASSPAKKEYHH